MKMLCERCKCSSVYDKKAEKCTAKVWHDILYKLHIDLQSVPEIGSAIVAAFLNGDLLTVEHYLVKIQIFVDRALKMLHGWNEK